MNIRYKTPEHSQADALLYEIGSVKRDLDGTLANLNREIQAIQERYSESIGILERSLSAKEKELTALQKKRKDALFDGEDKVHLAHGMLIHVIEERVVQAKGVLAKLEHLGRTEFVKVAKSVDWDKLRVWSDEELAAVGTRREMKEKYGYELNSTDERSGNA